MAMKRTAVLAAILAAGSVAIADDERDRGKRDGKDVSEFLLGVKEVPVVSTDGFGTFRAEISKDEKRIEYKLTFRGLEGDVTQAHIHVGPKGNTGAIVLWLCQTPTNPAPATTDPPQCFDDGDPKTLRSNTVKGVLTKDDVIPQAAHGIAEMEFDEIVDLIKAGKTYVNVHSAKFPPGEIRSQLDADHDHGHGHGDRRDDGKDRKDGRD
jgi:hypothetical protein